MNKQNKTENMGKQKKNCETWRIIQWLLSVHLILIMTKITLLLLALVVYIFDEFLCAIFKNSAKLKKQKCNSVILTKYWKFIPFYDREYLAAFGAKPTPRQLYPHFWHFRFRRYRYSKKWQSYQTNWFDWLLVAAGVAC